MFAVCELWSYHSDRTWWIECSYAKSPPLRRQLNVVVVMIVNDSSCCDFPRQILPAYWILYKSRWTAMLLSEGQVYLALQKRGRICPRTPGENSSHSTRIPTGIEGVYCIFFGVTLPKTNPLPVERKTLVTCTHSLRCASYSSYPYRLARKWEWVRFFFLQRLDRGQKVVIDDKLTLCSPILTLGPH